MWWVRRCGVCARDGGGGNRMTLLPTGTLLMRLNVRLYFEKLTMVFGERLEN